MLTSFFLEYAHMDGCFANRTGILIKGGSIDIRAFIRFLFEFLYTRIWTRDLILLAVGAIREQIITEYAVTQDSFFIRVIILIIDIIWDDYTIGSNPFCYFDVNINNQISAGRRRDGTAISVGCDHLPTIIDTVTAIDGKSIMDNGCDGRFPHYFQVGTVLLPMFVVEFND